MTLLPQSARMPYFMILALIGNIPQGATNMCVVQLLLQATPKKNRALIISIYTLFVTLSNSLLPFFGVSVYTALGANDTAIFTVNCSRVNECVITSASWDPSSITRICIRRNSRGETGRNWA